MIRRPRRVRLAALACTALAAMLACASTPLRLVDDASGRYFEHAEIGYRIALPVWPEDERWRAESVEGADLAYVGPQGDQMAMLSDCKATDAEVNVLSRNLALGFRDQKLLASRPVSVAARSGWERVFETTSEGRTSRVKTVTVRAGGCTFDWIFVTRPGVRFMLVEPVFDAWIASFEPPPPGPDAARGGAPS